MKANKLRGLIKAGGLTEGRLAELIGISSSSMSLRLSGQIEFTPSEMKAIKRELDMSDEDFMDIFFRD